MSLNDILSKERTHLSNERTLLAYFRTMIVMFSSGAAILKISWLADIKAIGFGLVIIAPLIMFFGLYKYYKIKKRINSYYSEPVLNKAA